MDNTHQIEEMQALIDVLRGQLQSAINAVCTMQAKVVVLEARLAKLQPQESPNLRAVE
jgi:hypothetical protein